MSTNINLTCRILRSLGLGLFFVGTWGHSGARAAIQPIPLVPDVSQDCKVQLSGDGNVVVGHHSSGKKLWGRWTAETGFVACPLTPQAFSWLDVTHLSYDGNVVVGSGLIFGSRQGAMTWRVGVGVHDLVGGTLKKSVQSIGVSPDGSYVVVNIDTNSSSVVERQYADARREKWLELDGQDFDISGTCADASRLIGNAPQGSYIVPCYWSSSGHLVVAPGFNKDGFPEMCSRDGKLILGWKDYGNSTKMFLWDTEAETVEYFPLSGYASTFPTFFSPDGTILGMEATAADGTLYEFVIDRTSAEQAAKGPQHVPTWMIEQQYLTSDEAAAHVSFGIIAFSDDRSVLLGYYNDTSTFSERRYFVTRRPTSP